MFLKKLLKDKKRINRVSIDTAEKVTWLGRLAIPIPPAGDGADMVCGGKRVTGLPEVDARRLFKLRDFQAPAKTHTFEAS